MKVHKVKVVPITKSENNIIKNVVLPNIISSWLQHWIEALTA